MNNLLIRKAESRDLKTLLRFEQGVVEAERAFDPTLAAAGVQYYDLEHLLTSPAAELAVAELHGQVVGSGYARLETSKPYLKHPRHAYLGFMYVLPEHRGQGVNQLLLAHLRQWVRNQGVFEMRLEVYEHNASAIKSYEKTGFVRHMVEMRLALSTTDDDPEPA